MSASATNNSAQSEEVATKGKGKAMDAGRDVEMDEDDESGEEESGVDEQVEGISHTQMFRYIATDRN